MAMTANPWIDRVLPDDASPELIAEFRARILPLLPADQCEYAEAVLASLEKRDG